MSEDKEKDSTNAQYFDPLYSPNELAEEKLAERMARYMEEFNAELRSRGIPNPTEISRPLYALPQLTPMTRTLDPQYIEARVLGFEDEIRQLNADILQLKTTILKLETEIQDLKKNKED